MMEPPTVEETSPEHQCWWRGIAEGLSQTLTELDSDSRTSALRQMLRGEKERRRKAEAEAMIWEYRARELGWSEPASVPGQA